MRKASVTVWTCPLIGAVFQTCRIAVLILLQPPSLTPAASVTVLLLAQLLAFAV